MKLFLNGHALQSVLLLNDFNLSKRFFPMLQSTNQQAHSFVTQGLKDTDFRVHNDKSVNPGYLLAVFLWNEVNQDWQKRKKTSINEVVALNTAINKAGIKKRGILSANSEREARRIVKDLDLTPIKIAESKKSSKSIKIKNKDLVIMTRQLSTLLEASIPIVEALDITANQMQNKNLIYIIYSLREDIIQGNRLGVSMKKFPSVFSSTYISMVSAGDSSGNLDISLTKMMLTKT